MTRNLYHDNFIILRTAELEKEHAKTPSKIEKRLSMEEKKCKTMQVQNFVEFIPLTWPMIYLKGDEMFEV